MGTLWEMLQAHMLEEGIPNAATLARRCGVHESQLSRLKTMRDRQPTAATLRKLAAGTGIDIFDMLLALGYTATELRGTDRRALSNEELLALVRERMLPVRTGSVDTEETVGAPDRSGDADVAADAGTVTDLPVDQGDDARVGEAGEGVNDDAR